MILYVERGGGVREVGHGQLATGREAIHRTERRIQAHHHRVSRKSRTRRLHERRRV